MMKLLLGFICLIQILFHYQSLILFIQPMTELAPENSLHTQICSPARTTAASTWKQNLALTQTHDNCNSLTDVPYLTKSSKKTSITEQQIMSHPAIKQIINQNKANTVDHNVNIIPIDTKLYNVPLQPITNQFKVDDVTKLSPDYVSTSSQKIKQFHLRLGDERDLAQRLQFLKDKNKLQCAEAEQKLKNNRSKFKYATNPRLTQSQVDNANRRVSVSGLVSYNFNSVSGRRSLGSIPNVPEEVALAKKVTENKRRNSCSVDRNAKILSRKPSPHNKNVIEFSRAAVSNFQTPTDLFLSTLREQNIKRKQIYGQKMQKLDCIRQFMQKQKADYQFAQYIVETIANSQRKQPEKKKEKTKIVIDDEKQLAKRKQVLSNRRILMKHLYFTD